MLHSIGNMSIKIWSSYTKLQYCSILKSVIEKHWWVIHTVLVLICDADAIFVHVLEKFYKEIPHKFGQVYWCLSQTQWTAKDGSSSKNSQLFKLHALRELWITRVTKSIMEFSVTFSCLLAFNKNEKGTKTENENFHIFFLRLIIFNNLK